MIRALLLFAALAWSNLANAGLAALSPPSGWSGSPAQWTFGGSTAAANSPWVGGSASANVTTTVLGRQVTVPATMRLAANAGQYAARAALLTPLGRIASIAAWLTLGGLTYDALTNTWTKTTNANEVEYYYTSYNGDAAFRAREFNSFSSGCSAFVAANSTSGTSVFVYKNVVVSPNGNIGTCYVIEYNQEGAVRDSNKAYGQIGKNERSYPVAQTRVATPEDADAVAASHPMTDQAANDATKVMPLPVQVPELSPYEAPLGPPYTKDGVMTQDKVKITPANDASSPWLVDIDARSAPVGNTDPAAETPVELTECEKTPDIVGCAKLGDPVDVPWAEETRNVSMAPQSPWGAGDASCPTPPTVTVGGQSVTIDNTLVCQFFSGIRFAVLAMATLLAVMIFIGARGGSE